jgi:hypothetical protein
MMDGFNISIELLEWMKENLDGNLLELGSGEGTKELIKHFDNVYSVEDQEAYQNLHHSNYLNVPLINHIGFNWYDREILQEKLKGIEYNAILVDGPTGSITRAGFLKNIDLFNIKHTIPIIVDDTHRHHEKRMFRQLCEIYPFRRVEIINCKDKQASILL